MHGDDWITWMPEPGERRAKIVSHKRRWPGLFLVAIVAALATAATLSISGASGAPATYRCAGVPAGAPRTDYPEPRVYLETQIWWTPMPKTAKTGHIHVGTCFPLYQTVTGSTLHFDIKAQVHDWDGSGGTVFNPLFGPDGEGLWNLRDLGLFPPNVLGMDNYSCPVEQCEGWISWDANIAGLPWSGWDQWDFALQGNLQDGRFPRTLSVWMMNVQNGKPPYPAGNTYGCSDNSCANRWVGGESWFPGETGFGSKYARADLPRDQLEKLWDVSTGALKPLTGTVMLTVRMEKPGDRVMVDPAFHAHPPSTGTIVHQGNGGLTTFALDTTKLANGEHRLVMQNRYDRNLPNSQSGLLVVPFLVDNPAPEPTTTSTTTTEPTTTMTMPTTTTTETTTTTPAPYHPDCEPTCDADIAKLKSDLAAHMAMMDQLAKENAALKAKIKKAIDVLNEP